METEVWQSRKVMETEGAGTECNGNRGMAGTEGDGSRGVAAEVWLGLLLGFVSFSAVLPDSPTETLPCDSLSLPGCKATVCALKLHLGIPSFHTTQSVSSRQLN